MTVDQLKKYLKSIRSAGQDVPQLDDLVEVAMDAAFGQVWGKHRWKVRLKTDSSLTQTVSQAYTILPSDMESVISLVAIDGRKSRWINLKGVEHFDMDYPQPSSRTSGRPIEATLDFAGFGQNKNFWVYWDKLPDSALSLRLRYLYKAGISTLPSLPTYMVPAVVEKAVALILSPGQGRLEQDQVAKRALDDAMSADNEVLGLPLHIDEVDAGFNNFAEGRSHVRAPWENEYQ